MKGKRLLSLLLVLLLVLSLMPVSLAEEEQELYVAEVEGTYGQSGARSMLAMVNALRTGEDAWYWDEDNTNKVVLSGLAELQYSYALEEIAMQRAIEVALSFSHTRPDGTSSFTCLATDGTRSWGENIAAGYSDAQSVFVGWCETDEDYAGQGHRRNMLEDFAAIGIGHVVYNGTHYWVQEFSWDLELGTEVPACDNAQTHSVTLAPSRVASYGKAVLDPASQELQVGNTAPAPRAGAVMELVNAWQSMAPTGWFTPAWESSDPAVVTVADGLVTAACAGEASLTATVFGGQTVTVPVTVTGGLAPIYARIAGQSISAKGNIGLNLYLYLSDGLLEDADAYVTLGGEKLPVAQADTREVDGQTAYRFSLSVPAKNMGDIMTLRVFDGQGRAVKLLHGQEDLTESGFAYSVRDYLDTVIQGGEPGALWDLCAAMRDYGSCAQAVFRYDEEHRPSLMTDLSTVSAADVRDCAPILTAAQNSGLVYQGSSLLLRSETGLRHYFTPEQGRIGDYSFFVNGQSVVPVSKDGAWYVEVPSLTARQLTEMPAVTVAKAGEEIFSLRYGPLSYVCLALESGGDEALLNQARALAVYARAAAIYFG